MPSHRRRTTLNDIAHKGGRPLTTSELAEILGLSATFIRNEINSGHLHAVRIGRGRRRPFRIPVLAAVRYARELGLLSSKRSTS
jgi:excisionase family DNA binding protein